MSGGDHRGPTVLVVEPDPDRRRLLARGLVDAGARVIEASVPDDVVEASVPEDAGDGTDHLDAAVVGGEASAALALLARLARRYPGARLVLQRPPPPDAGSWPLAMEGDVAAVVDAVGLSGPVEDGGVLDLAGIEAAQLAEQWAELCRWDPLLPPESRPPMAGDVVAAVVAALAQPQPLGYGPEPDMEQVAERFAASLNSLEEAIEQLVCLREAMRRRFQEQLPSSEVIEPLARMDMVIDRAIGVASRSAAARLKQEALQDPLTGLRNRRALGQDLPRELRRAGRRGSPLAVVGVDVVGLKSVNDRLGHPAGDRLLRSLADALARAVRAGDLAYRVGGDEFALVLVDTGADGAAAAMARVAASGAPDVRWGAAVYPEDGSDATTLLARADERLMAAPGQRR